MRRLVTAVSEAGHSKALLVELARKEAELQEITDRLFSNNQESIEARVGEIRMTPHRSEKHLFYIAEGTWDLLGRDPMWTEGASMVTGVFGWLRGSDLN